MNKYTKNRRAEYIADEICREFGNERFRFWYLHAANCLPESVIWAAISQARQAGSGKLLSFILKSELTKLGK
jgi:hypothetical protein